VTRLRLLAIAAVAILVEVVSRLGLVALEARGVIYDPIADTLPAVHRVVLARVVSGATHYIEPSSDLGWTLQPGGGVPPLYRANAEGFRAEREYTPDPPAGVLRFAAFGDSFTHSDDVPYPDTWSTRLERPGLEVLNFGVGGYGLDQALLRYRRDGKRYHARVVLIGFMSEDIERGVSVYRPFYHPATHEPMAKPRFRMVLDTLALVPNPVPKAEGYRALLDSTSVVLARLGADDWFYRTREHVGPLDALGSVRLAKLALRVARQSNGPMVRGMYNPRSEAFRLAVATFAEFVREVRADGAVPVVLIFPTRWDIRRYWRSGTRTYDALRPALDSAGLPYLDLVEAFDGCRRLDPTTLAPRHYSALGNAQVAAFLAARIDSNGIRPPPPASGPATCATADTPGDR